METVGWHGRVGGGIAALQVHEGELSWCFSNAVQIRTRLKGLELFLKNYSLSEWDA